MKQIKNLDLSRLRTEECFGFLQQVASLVKTMLTVETDKAMVDAYTAAEEAYKVFVQRVNALCIVMGEESYGPFIDQVNVVIDTQNATIAARETKAAKKRVKEE